MKATSDKFLEDLEAVVVSVGRPFAEAALLEYAAGQPRDKKGRFGATGGGGGGGAGGGALDASKVIDITKKETGATLPTKPSTAGVLVTGETPKVGYAVATGIAGKVVDSSEFFNKETGVKIVDDFLVSNAAHFANESHFLGTWFDAKTNLVHLDISEVFPAGQRRIAIQAGKDRDQISIFNLKTRTEIFIGGAGGIKESGQGSSGAGEHDARGATQGSGATLGDAFVADEGIAGARSEYGGAGRDSRPEDEERLHETLIIRLAHGIIQK